MVYGSSKTFIQDNYAEILQGGNYQLLWSDGKKTTINTKQIPDEKILDGQWKIHFMEKPSLGEPIDTEIDSLKAWTEFSQRTIKYFSGTARYEKTFKLS